MSLKTRKPKRDAAKMFARVIERDDKGRVKVVEVPGSEGKTYKVIIRRGSFGYQTECQLSLGKLGWKPCQGDSHGTICYHSQAAINLAAEAKGKVYWCNDKQAALNVTHFNQGQAIPVTSRTSSKAIAWITFELKPNG